MFGEYFSSGLTSQMDSFRKEEKRISLLLSFPSVLVQEEGIFIRAARQPKGSRDTMRRELFLLFSIGHVWKKFRSHDIQ